MRPRRSPAGQSCFFFQAEDGIRDKLVTGVQTCALPIFLLGLVVGLVVGAAAGVAWARSRTATIAARAKAAEEKVAYVEERLSERFQALSAQRSEERRVGEEGRSRWSPDH